MLFFFGTIYLAESVQVLVHFFLEDVIKLLGILRKGLQISPSFLQVCSSMATCNDSYVQLHLSFFYDHNHTVNQKYQYLEPRLRPGLGIPIYAWFEYKVCLAFLF